MKEECGITEKGIRTQKKTDLGKKVKDALVLIQTASAATMYRCRQNCCFLFFYYHACPLCNRTSVCTDFPLPLYTQSPSTVYRKKRRGKPSVRFGKPPPCYLLSIVLILPALARHPALSHRPPPVNFPLSSHFSFSSVKKTQTPRSRLASQAILVT